MATMTIEMAREICRLGFQYNAMEEDPKSFDDAKAFRLAGELRDTAAKGYANGSRHDAVLEVLFAAQVEPTKEGEYADVYERKQATPPTPSSPTTESAPAPAAPAPTGSAAVFAPAAGGEVSAPLDSIESIFPGYDDKKVAEIKELVLGSASSGDLSPEEWEQIKAYEATHEERKTVLNLQPEFKQPDASPAASPAGSGAPTDDYASKESMANAYGHGSIGSDLAAQSGLPLPAKPEGEAPLLPIDITAISDQELSRLATRYHSLLVYALWIVSQEEGRAAAAASLKDDAYRDAYSVAFGRIRSGLEKETTSALDGARSEARHEAEAAEAVQIWRNRETRHTIEARGVKALAAGYDKAVWRLNEDQERRNNAAKSSNGAR